MTLTELLLPIHLESPYSMIEGFHSCNAGWKDPVVKISPYLTSAHLFRKMKFLRFLLFLQRWLFSPQKKCPGEARKLAGNCHFSALTFGAEQNFGGVFWQNCWTAFLKFWWGDCCQSLKLVYPLSHVSSRSNLLTLTFLVFFGKNGTCSLKIHSFPFLQSFVG